MMLKIFHNADLIDKKSLSISIDDRLYRFGDGLFETISIINGKAFLVESHLQRLKNGLNALQIKVDFYDIASQINLLIKENKIENGIARIIVSRGEDSQGYLPEETCKAYYLITAEPYHFKKMENLKLMLSNWQRPSVNSYPANFKTANALSSVLAKIEANEYGVYDSIQCDHDHYIIECSSANIVFMKKNIIYYPKDNGERLEGITLSIFKKITTEFESVEKRIHKSDLNNFDEVYIMNSVIGIASVAEIKNVKNYQTTNDKSLSKKYEEFQRSYYRER
jgi:branched-chain amino acid aminotransferase